MIFGFLRNRDGYAGRGIVVAVLAMWLTTGFQACLAAVPEHSENNEATPVTAIQLSAILHQISITSECPAPLCLTITGSDANLANSSDYMWTTQKYKPVYTVPTHVLFNAYNTTVKKQLPPILADYIPAHPNTLYNVLRI